MSVQFRLAGPAYLGSAAANIYTPPASTILVRIRQIHLCNVTTGTITATLYIGATGGSAGGTEILKDKSVGAKDVYDEYFQDLVMKSTDFLSGLASAGSSMTITLLGDMEVVP
jgi:hypothetical protein